MRKFEYDKVKDPVISGTEGLMHIQIMRIMRHGQICWLESQSIRKV